MIPGEGKGEDVLGVIRVKLDGVWASIRWNYYGFFWLEYDGSSEKHDIGPWFTDYGRSIRWSNWVLIGWLAGFGEEDLKKILKKITCHEKFTENMLHWNRDRRGWMNYRWNVIAKEVQSIDGIGYEFVEIEDRVIFE